MKTVKKLLKYIRIIIASVILFLIGYWLFVYIASAISTTPVIEEPEIDIYILSNGVHTDIVVPTSNTTMNWQTLFPIANTSIKSTAPEYLALGWGNKGFYLETPTWNDLTFSTAFKAVFGLSESAIHATYHHSMKVNNTDCFKISISEKQYTKLCDYITTSLKLKNNKSIYIQTEANYGTTDAFYEANQSYSLFYTCNTWANNALKTCEQRAALWTPFDKGIIQHYKK